MFGKRDELCVRLEGTASGCCRITCKHTILARGKASDGEVAGLVGFCAARTEAVVGCFRFGRYENMHADHRLAAVVYRAFDLCARRADNDLKSPARGAFFNL